MARAGRLAVGVAAAGLLLPLPVTAIGLGIAARCVRAAAQQHAAGAAGTRPPA